MNTLNGNIQLRFTGGGINPNVVDAGDVAALITKYKDSSRAIILATPGVANEEILFCLTQVEDQSLSLVFTAKASFLAANLLFTAAVENGNIAHLPGPAKDFAKSVKKFTAENKCRAEFIDSGSAKPLTVITSHSNFVTDFETALEARIYIYGKLERIGGAKPRATILAPDGQTRLSCLLNEAQAKSLGPRLYDEVGLECESNWSWAAQPDSEFKVTSILPYVRKTPSEAVKALQAALTLPYNHENGWEEDD